MRCPTRVIATLVTVRSLVIGTLLAATATATVAFRPGSVDDPLEEYAASMRLDDTDNHELSRQEAIELARHSGLRSRIEWSTCVGTLGRMEESR